MRDRHRDRSAPRETSQPCNDFLPEYKFNDIKQIKDSKLLNFMQKLCEKGEKRLINTDFSRVNLYIEKNNETKEFDS